jgi:outer membrane protein TolC
MNRSTLRLPALLLALLPFTLMAQPVAWDEIIPPPEATDVPYAERLVQLAWQNYSENRKYEINVLASEKAIGLARLGWLDILTMQFNLNSRTIGSFGDFQSSDNQFFPWYNVGINVSPSRFFTVPAETQMARFDHENSIHDLNAQKLRLRAETLTRYERYKHNLEQLKVISENYETANSTFILIRERFNQGEATFEDFNAASLARIGALTGKMTGELELRLAKIALEELIGMKLEQVIR